MRNAIWWSSYCSASIVSSRHVLLLSGSGSVAPCARCGAAFNATILCLHVVHCHRCAIPGGCAPVIGVFVSADVDVDIQYIALSALRTLTALVPCNP
jgi:hypothetical protein